MEIVHRDLLVGAASLGLTGMIGPLGLGFAEDEYPGATGRRWHPLTKSLLDRAKLAGNHVDRVHVERIIHDVANEHDRLVIKWMASPVRAFEYLLRYPLDELAQMPTARLWPFPLAVSATDYEAEERSIELHQLNNRALRVDEHGRALIAPKLDFRARAIASQSRPERIFEAR